MEAAQHQKREHHDAVGRPTAYAIEFHAQAKAIAWDCPVQAEPFASAPE